MCNNGARSAGHPPANDDALQWPTCANYSPTSHPPQKKGKVCHRFLPCVVLATWHFKYGTPNVFRCSVHRVLVAGRHNRKLYLLFCVVAVSISPRASYYACFGVKADDSGTSRCRTLDLPAVRGMSGCGAVAGQADTRVQSGKI